MTAPLCHGTAGGCHVDISHDTIHTDSCPTVTSIRVPFAPPTKRTMGQCSEECQQYRAAQSARAWEVGHIAACPALYSLKRQPGDEKDALTRLTALCRTAWEIGRKDAGRISADDFEAQALALISEARQNLTDAHAERHERESELCTMRADLARAKVLCRTLTSSNPRRGSRR